MTTKLKNPGIAKARKQLGTLQKVADFVNARRKGGTGKITAQKAWDWENGRSPVPVDCTIILIEGLNDITLRDLYPQHVVELLDS